MAGALFPSFTSNDRRQEGTLSGPSMEGSSCHGLWRKTQVAIPVGFGHRFSVKRQPNIGPCVIRLRNYVSPAAVARLVVAFVVDAVKRVIRRSRPHIGIEGLKRVAPAIAQANAATAVVLIAIRARVVATAFQRPPSLVFAAIRAAMLRKPFLSAVTSEATATLSPPHAQRLGSGARHLPAIAHAIPYGYLLSAAVSAVNSGSFEYDEVAKSLACEIDRERSGHIAIFPGIGKVVHA